jgi:hypothetical protein
MVLFLSFQPPEERPVIRLVLEHGRAVMASADDLSADRQAWERAPWPSTRGGLGLAFPSEVNGTQRLRIGLTLRADSSIFTSV